MNSESVGSLSISDEPAFNEVMFESSTLNRDNRSGIALGSTVGSDLLNCEALLFESTNLTSESMLTVSWIRNGYLVKNTSSFSSSLEITDFALSDAGVYQCIFTNTNTNGEIITTVPYRLDTGTQSLQLTGSL